MPSNVDKNEVVVTRFEEDECPCCGYKLDAASSTNGYEVPRPGDLSICISCTSVLEFDDNMKLRMFSQDELDNLSQEEIDNIVAAQNHIRKQKTLH